MQAIQEKDNGTSASTDNDRAKPIPCTSCLSHQLQQKDFEFSSGSEGCLNKVS